MLKIAIVSSEAAPFAKTGGLGDVVTSLAKELVALGNQVTLMLPLYSYKSILPTGLISPLQLNFSGRQVTYSIVESTYSGIRLVFIDAPQYFRRSGIYGDESGTFGDNDERFVFFTRACLEYFKRKDQRPDILHCNDWPTALFPLFLQTHYHHDPLSKTPVLFTIHNVAYQGNFGKESFSLLELGPEYFTHESLEFYGSLSFLKGGLLYSDILTTVSPRYSREIQTDENGSRMQGVLRARKDRLFGVLNGMDDGVWNPETDPQIAKNYSWRDTAGKAECRTQLLEEAGFKYVEDRPILAILTRFAMQKGMDLIEAVAEKILDLDTYLFVLGTGGARYEQFFRDLQEKHPDRVSAAIRFDEEYAHRLQAGADMLLMPSRYEPCGLNQMHGMKYGTVPIVRATGGLDDTVEEWNPETKTGTGFKFEPYEADPFLEAVTRARSAFCNRTTWEHLMRNGMHANFCWKNSALIYLSLYDQAIQLKS